MFNIQHRSIIVLIIVALVLIQAVYAVGVGIKRLHQTQIEQLTQQVELRDAVTQKNKFLFENQVSPR